MGEGEPGPVSNVCYAQRTAAAHVLDIYWPLLTQISKVLFGSDLA